jgi:hypothetical protein
MKNLADKNVLWDEKSSRVKLPLKYKNLVDLILISKGLNRHKSSKAYRYYR